MTREFRIRWLLLVVLALDALALGLFFYAVSSKPGMLSGVLPGQFGAGAERSFTGNYVFAGLLALLNGLLFVLFGSFAVLRRVIADVDAGGRSAARRGLSRASWVALLGAVLLGVGLPFFTWSVARADMQGVPLFDVANAQVDSNAATFFAVDQIAGAILLDVPEIYELRGGTLTPNPAHPFMPHVAFLFRVLIGLWFFSSLLSFWRMRYLARASTTFVAESVAPALSTSFLRHDREARSRAPIFAQAQNNPADDEDSEENLARDFFKTGTDTHLARDDVPVPEPPLEAPGEQVHLNDDASEPPQPPSPPGDRR